MILPFHNHNSSRTPIAVIGLGCWYPGARNPIQFWENILSRRLEFRTIPNCRLPLDDYCDTTGKSVDKMYSQRAALIDGFEFDWIGRRIPKSMFESTDLVHWLCVEVAEQALSDAGYSKATVDKAGTGVIVGNTLTGDITRAETVRLRWPFVRRALQAACKAHGLSEEAFNTLEVTMEKTFKSVFSEPNPDSLAGGLANTIAGRVCNYFDLHGGGYIVDGACASSLLAVCTAARALSIGDLDAVLVGGVDISIDPFELVGFSRAGALTKTDMKVYDKSASGFIPGEGCGFVMLKRLADARRDGNKIYAVIQGWGISSDGKGGIMTPTSAGQALAIRRAYATAGYSPADLDFVEGHGTGTVVGDVTELKGIHEAQSHPSNPMQPIHRRTGMTSLKSVVGHTKAAAGIGAFIKATMAVNRRVLPPTGSCTVPHPTFNDTCKSLYPLTQGRIADPRANLRAGISAMGFGGINSHVTIESGDDPIENLQPVISESKLLVSNQTSELFAFSASTFALLAEQLQGLLAYASQLSCADLIDLAALLAEQVDNSLPIRAAIVATSVDELVNRLEALVLRIAQNPPYRGEVVDACEGNVWISNESDQSRIGFLFPGQGSQQLGMARKLVARFDWAQEMVSLADRVQLDAGLAGVSETMLCDTQRNIDREQLNELRKSLARTENAQVAIVTASAIYARFLGLMGIQPVVCGGHSLGELTALYQAGAFSFESLLHLVSLRGRVMASPKGNAGAMAALLCSRSAADALIAATPGYVVLANINSPNQVVVSGDESAIASIMESAARQQITAVRLNVSNAFHSKYVSEASQLLREHAPIPSCPQRFDIDVFSCIDGEPVSSDVNLHDYLARQVVENVDFVAMVHGIEPNCDLLIEVGPSNVLTKLTADIIDTNDGSCMPTASLPDVDCCMNRVLAKSFVHGVNLQWETLFENRLYRPFVPPHNRVFIQNPCEKDFAEIVDAAPIMLQSESRDPLHSALLSNDGIPTSIDLIHNHIEGTTGTPTMIQKLATASEIPSSHIDDGIDHVLLDIIQERTGFPKHTLMLDQRLLDDLNLDSIKAGDIVATAAIQLGIQGSVEPANLGDATIADIIHVVRMAKQGGQSSMESMTETAMPPAMDHLMASSRSMAQPMVARMGDSDSIAGHGNGQHAAMPAQHLEMPCTKNLACTSESDSTGQSCQADAAMSEEMDSSDWVRSYVVDIVRHRNIAEQLDISNRHFRVLYDPCHEYFIELLARRFNERGATSSFELYDDPGHVIGQEQPAGTQLYAIALLPREIPMATSREKLERMVHRLHRAVALAKTHPQQPQVKGLTFVEFGNGCFGTQGMTDVERSGAAAFARALHLESPALQVRVVDFADELSDFLATDFITNEIATHDQYCDAAYDRFGRRFETRHRMLQPNMAAPLSNHLGARDVILVTGGARGITAECALALAQRTGASFALVGSSPHPATANNGASSEISETLKRFSELPGKCEYFACDLTDEMAVRDLVSKVDAKLGRITGVIHGAGRNMPAAAATPSLDSAMSEVSPKVLGAANLLEALADRPLRCLVGLTSIIGVTGIPGNSWYAFSNEVLDLILRQYKVRQPECLVRSISYSAWREVGMGAKGQVEKNLRRMGVGMIPLQEGVNRFIHALEHDLEDVQVLVTGSLGGIDTWRPLGMNKCTHGARFIDDVVQHEPGVSITTRVTLDFQSDPYLEDHIYSGTCLFPAVLGMEAMAQVAAHLMPERPKVVRLQNIDLPRPIIVPDQGSVTLEIHAMAAEMNAAGETVVSVGIRSERSQFQYDHFSAEVVFGEPQVGPFQPEAPTPRLDIDPQRDLYNGIMFQGPRFQRWGDTFQLQRGLMRLDVKHCCATCHGEGVFGEGVFGMGKHGDALLTGDPFYRDVMLQSIQALIPQRIGLPLSIERIDFYSPADVDAAPANRRLLLSKMNVIGDKVGEEHICEVIAKDPCGHVREHMTGYRVKVLAINDTYPTADQLADLGGYEQDLLVSQVGPALKHAGLASPAIMIKRMPELHQLTREERHHLEHPLLQATASELLMQTGNHATVPMVTWLPSGRPVVSNDSSCQLSLSHDEDYCMCIANIDIAGCDLEPVTSRTHAEWTALLGQRNMPLVDKLTGDGDCPNKAGTRIWTAMEAVKKAIDKNVAVTLSVVSRVDGTVAFASDALGDALLITLPVKLHRQPVRMLAIVAPKAKVSMSSAGNGHAHSNGNGSSRHGDNGNGSMMSSAKSTSPTVKRGLVASQVNSAMVPKALSPIGSSKPMAASPMAASPMAASPMAASPMAVSPMAASKPMAASPMAASPMAASPMAASKPMAASQSMSGLAPAKPMAAKGTASGGTRTQAEMLAMAKYATAAMSPDEAQSADHQDMAMKPAPMAAAPMAAAPMAAAPMRMPHAESTTNDVMPYKPVAQTASCETMATKCSSKSDNFASPGEIRVIEDITAIHKWDGPQDQPVFEYKFPVTFKECAKKGKHVQLAQYVDWMGMLREDALLYLCPEIADKLFDGLSGMSTNFTDVNVVGELMMGDFVIARFFREEMTESSINLVCDFCKLMPDGRLIRVAFVRQKTTWVALEGKKEPTKSVFPKFLVDAFRKVAPRKNDDPQYPELMGNLGRLKIEEERLRAVRSGKPTTVWSEEFQTTSADSNIVQNIYHSRYFNWQWRTTDLFLYQVVPQLVSNVTAIGNVRELVVTSARIDYFRDAFPFDRIRTELAVTRSTACAATLQFTHYRVLESGEQQKLAVATQDVVWVRRTPAATAAPEPFPKAVRDALEAALAKG